MECLFPILLKKTLVSVFFGHLVLGTGTIHELTQFYSTLKRITQQNFSEKYQTTQP